MTPDAAASPLTAALEIASYLDSKEIPCVVMGGLAVQHWGEPGATRVVDAAVMVPAESVDDFLEETVGAFRPRIADAATFARQSRVLLVRAGNDVPIDLSLGIPGYEEEVMRRAVAVEWTGAQVRLIGAEDLIIHKCVAGRPRDLEDVRSILERRGERPDLAYVRWYACEPSEPVAPEGKPRSRPPEGKDSAKREVDACPELW